MSNITNPEEIILHHVYILYDPRKNNQEFYIGVSRDEKRRFKHLEEAKRLINQDKSQNWIMENCDNPHKTRTIMKILRAGLEPKIEKVMENVDEQTAKAEEIRLIAHHGRADKGLGPLTNMTDGGDGMSNRIITSEFRENISEKITEVWKLRTEKEKEKISSKISNSSKGVSKGTITPKTKETREKISEGLKKYQVSPEGINQRKNYGENRKEYHKTEEGKEYLKEKGKRRSEYFKTEAGMATRKKLNRSATENNPRYWLGKKSPRIGTKWYNNGKDQGMFREENIPNGWIAGRLSFKK